MMSWLLRIRGSFSESESIHSSYNLFIGGPVKWFGSSILINFWFKEEREMRTSSMWPWLARMGIKVVHTRLPYHEGVPLLNLNLIHYVAITLIGNAVYDLQRSAAGKWLQHCLQSLGWRTRAWKKAEKPCDCHRLMERCKGKVSFLMDNGKEQWCLMWSWNENIAN